MTVHSVFIISNIYLGGKITWWGSFDNFLVHFWWQYFNKHVRVEVMTLRGGGGGDAQKLECFRLVACSWTDCPLYPQTVPRQRITFVPVRPVGQPAHGNVVLYVWSRTLSIQSTRLKSSLPELKAIVFAKVTWDSPKLARLSPGSTPGSHFSDAPIKL